MAVVDSETLHHDLVVCAGSKVISMLNYCTSTRHSTNGSICCMAPWEGVWVFHGTEAKERFGLPYGFMFLPTITPQVHEQYSSRAVLSFTMMPSKGSVTRLWDTGQCHAQEGEGMMMMMQSLLQEVESMEEGLAAQQQAMLLAEADGAGDPELMLAYKRSIAKLSASSALSKKNKANATRRPKKRFLLFDEHILMLMSKKGWNRSLGYTALVPLACGLCEDWWHYQQFVDAERAGKEAHAMYLQETGH